MYCFKGYSWSHLAFFALNLTLTSSIEIDVTALPLRVLLIPVPAVLFKHLNFLFLVPFTMRNSTKELLELEPLLYYKPASQICLSFLDNPAHICTFLGYLGLLNQYKLFFKHCKVVSAHID